MVVPMMRKILVLALAALGVQYLRVIARVLARELRPQSGPELELAAARAQVARQRATSGASLAPRGLRISTLEPQGAI